jgi:hypothetical protein
MFAAKQFLDLSHSLLSSTSGNGLDEARYRTIANRSLYAVFLIAREELEKRGCKVKCGPINYQNEHDRVRAEFRPPEKNRPGGRFKSAQVSSRLDGLYRLRWQADYQPEDEITLNDAQQALEYADYILLRFSDTLFKQS